MTETDIREWFFEKYESDTPAEEWDMLDIWEEVCRLEINNSIMAKIILESLIKEGLI